MSPSKHIHKSIIEILNNNGPMLGKELVSSLPSELSQFHIWKTCFGSHYFQISHFARYYLRYDITRDDYIRLSPSILRDFLSFTIISLPHQRDEVIERQILLSNEHREISLSKINCARMVLNGLDALLSREDKEKICAFVAGDITYFLGHLEPRECTSTGKIVKGSDIDIVIVYDDALSPDVLETIEGHLLTQKSILLKHPEVREELDFVCKPFERMREQFSYDDIHRKIACKILYESLHVYGSEALYSTLLNCLESYGVRDLIEADFLKGMRERNSTIKKLMSGDLSTKLTPNEQSLFFFSEERLEFT